MNAALSAKENTGNTRKECKVICLVSQKGGIAKTFTSASLSVGLVGQGKKAH